MLPMLQRELIEKRKWSTEEELVNYYAIGQTTPGIIAVNTATFVGYSRQGVLGAVIATLGLVLPGVVIIILLARLITGFSELAPIRHAMAGIKAAVTVLILDALLRLRKSALPDAPSKIIFLLVLAAALLFPKLSPAILVLAAAVVGMTIAFRKRR